MKLLILGGTRFVGRHLVVAARAKGHRVTLLTRGLTNPGLFPDVETIIGDRNVDLSRLEGRNWDAVIDTCAYRPSQVRLSAALLSGQASVYCLISSVLVYATFPVQGASESCATHAALYDETAGVDGHTYGPLKVACEEEVLASFGERALIVRPSVLIGPFDPTDQLSYWVRRVAQGGCILAPGDPERRLQLLDARDLAQWVIARVTVLTTGTFNAGGPVAPLTMDGLLRTCLDVTRSHATVAWADDAFLTAHGVTPWRELPFWLPEHVASPLVISRRAMALGLSPRPLADTVHDVHAEWEATRQVLDGARERMSMRASREGELLGLLRGTHPDP